MVDVRATNDGRLSSKITNPSLASSWWSVWMALDHGAHPHCQEGPLIRLQTAGAYICTAVTARNSNTNRPSVYFQSNGRHVHLTQISGQAFMCKYMALNYVKSWIQHPHLADVPCLGNEPSVGALFESHAPQLCWQLADRATSPSRHREFGLKSTAEFLS